eukprot:scaffold11076_cov122-Cylindrotheca_fusiformis.AAC.7
MQKMLAANWLCFLCIVRVEGFFARHGKPSPLAIDLLLQSNEYDQPAGEFSRREAFELTVGGAFVGSGLASAEKANADDGYRPAPRPTAYRVDSTQPPTLIPLSSAKQEFAVLKKLGKGFGTDKAEILDDRVNLNNILNKAVFGSIDAVAGLTGGKKEESKFGPGYASFVCMGVPSKPSATDISQIVSLFEPMLKNRKDETAIGLAFCPLSTQSNLDDYLKSGNESTLVNALQQKGVRKDFVDLYLPLIRYAKTRSLDLLALSPETEDIVVARTKGLQNLDPDRRKSYVIDAEGFISMSGEPQFRMYTERSLLKDFTPINSDDKPGNFFSERILVHETAATTAATYAVRRPDSLVIVVAPIPDLRFLLGINGRIPRIYRFLDPTNTKVSDDAVTTVLVNPTANETLSKSRYLRLEIGTGPETLGFQSKVSDYLWFSSSPKVNLIPRLMNG